MIKLLVVLFLCFNFLLADELIIKRDESGRIIVTNRPDPPKKIVSDKKTSPKSTPLLNNYQSYVRDKIIQTAKRFGFDPQIAIAVAHIESGFNPFAISHKGAVGVMQLMDETAKDYGVNDRFQLDQNIEAGIRHLKKLHEKYNGNLKLILAAYNAGEKAVEQYNGIPPFKETQEYIKKIFKILGMSYEPLSPPTTKKPIYKLTYPDGKVMITDTIPFNFSGIIEKI